MPLDVFHTIQTNNGNSLGLGLRFFWGLGFICIVCEVIGIEFHSSTYGYPVLTCNIFEETFLKRMFLKLLCDI